MIILASLLDSLKYLNCLLWPVIQDAVLGRCTFLLCLWSKQLVTDCHWSNTLKQYYIQIWFFFMHRILFGDVFKFYKFLFWLSVWYDTQGHLLWTSTVHWLHDLNLPPLFVIHFLLPIQNLRNTTFKSSPISMHSTRPPCRKLAK